MGPPTLLQADSWALNPRDQAKTTFHEDMAPGGSLPYNVRTLATSTTEQRETLVGKTQDFAGMHPADNLKRL
jgi:hypothetical protein